MENLKIKNLKFLKDAFICSLGAYGGPEAHIGVFNDQLVTKKKYLAEDELIELLALCSILPGPTSTQTLVAIGYKLGGPMLAFLTMVVWALPVILAMTALALVHRIFSELNISLDALRYIGPMAVGFILVASYKIGKKVVKDLDTAVLMVVSAVSVYFIPLPFMFPLLLIIGGVFSILRSKEKGLWNKIEVKPKYGYLIAFIGIALGGLLLTILFESKLLVLVESFYRYGYLVFGGGQVVVPVMYSELVEVREYLSHSEFLSGYGLVQGLPGPMFSFSAYAGGMAYKDGTIGGQILASLISGIGIFLPGVLLIYFVYPIWESLKGIKAIKVSLKGINAVAGGLIAVAAIVLMQRSGFSVENLLVTGATGILLLTKKLPAPIIVLITIGLGIIL